MGFANWGLENIIRGGKQHLIDFSIAPKSEERIWVSLPIGGFITPDYTLHGKEKITWHRSKSVPAWYRRRAKSSLADGPRSASVNHTARVEPKKVDFTNNDGYNEV